MPELPEVETIKLGLSKKIIGKKITDIEIEPLRHGSGQAKSFQGNPRDVIDSSITDIQRRAKLIRVKLSNNLNLLFHLKLTGQLIYRSPSFSLSSNTLKRELQNKKDNSFSGGHPSHDWHLNLPNSNTRLIFSFNDSSKLYFNDLRKFGWCKVLSDQNITQIFGDVGAEPFSKDFTVEYLLSKAKRIPNRNIKQFLMDQTIIAGIGNIYTDETLFDAKISPLRKLKDIKLSEWQTIRQSILKILKLGIKYGGTTDSDYVNADGKKGGMQNHLKVYHRTGKSCPNGCGGKIERISIGGRGTHFCFLCQK